MKKISIISPCYNEEENLPELHRRLTSVMKQHPEYEYDILWGDNASTDHTRDVIRKICAQDKHVKAIFNSANFGHIRSPYHLIMTANGDAVIHLCADMQEPPEVLHEFIREWENGAKVVCGVKPKSKENPIKYFLRGCFYTVIQKISDTPQIKHFTGFGLYDRVVINALKQFNEPYPYLRGLVAEIGFKRVEVPYVQDARKHGASKNNFFTLYDCAMIGFVNHTKMPLRLAAFTGFILAFLSLLTAIAYFIYKLVYWDNFSVGSAPVVIGLFFFSAVQLIFIGVIGEYIGAIWTQVKNKPHVIEQERINF